MGRTGGPTARRQPGSPIRVCRKRVYYRSYCRTPLYYITPRFATPSADSPAAARRGHASCRNMRMRFRTTHVYGCSAFVSLHIYHACTCSVFVYLYVQLYIYLCVCVCVRACLRACVRARVCVRVLPNGCRCRGRGVRAGLGRPTRRCCRPPPPPPHMCTCVYVCEGE